MKLNRKTARARKTHSIVHLVQLRQKVHRFFPSRETPLTLDALDSTRGERIGAIRDIRASVRCVESNIERDVNAAATSYVASQRYGKANGTRQQRDTL